jgi:O-glycosyl hydrolase
MSRTLAAAEPRRRFVAHSVALCEPLEQRKLMAVDVTIDATDRRQSIDGFGTALGGSTPANLVKSDDFQKMYFQDLGSSMLRVALNFSTLKAADGNLATPVYLGPNIDKNIALFDWNQYNIKQSGIFARAAMKQGLDDTKIIAAIWSPPHWMKGPELNPNNGNVTSVQPVIDYTTYGVPNASGGSLIDTEANLTQFARWVAAYVKGFEQTFGAPIYALSIQNELAFHEPYHSCVYTPELYAKALKFVNRWFEVYGIETKLIGPEDVGVGSEKDPYILRRQFEYIKAIRRDPAAMEAMDGWAIHGYANDGVNTYRSPEMWEQYWNGRPQGNGPSWWGIKGDNKFSWMTETSGQAHNWIGAMQLASSAQDALVQGNVNAWVYWGIASGNTSYNNHALTAGMDYDAMKYVGAKHFFRFIRPGAVRLNTTETDPYGVYASAFVHDEDKTLTGVVINNDKQEQEVRLRLPNLDVANFTTGYLSTETDRWQRLRTIRIKNGVATVVLPPKSILTLQGDLNVAGSVSGFYFHDADGDGQIVRGEVGLPGDKVYIDLNGNGVRDRREPFSVTNAEGAFAFAALPPGDYKLRRDLPEGWTQTTAALDVSLRPGQNLRRLLIGATDGVAAAPPPPAAPALRGRLAGKTFGDVNANGVFDAGDNWARGKTIFLDADDDGVRDDDERWTVSAADGSFAFDNVEAGTYRVRRDFPAGYAYSTQPITITLTRPGESSLGLRIGGRTL